MTTIGERILVERRRMGLNQDQFAALGGITRGTQARYEKGERSPDSEYLINLGQQSVDVFYLLTGKRLSVAAGEIRESPASYSTKIYDKPEAALYAVLDVQQELGLTFTAEQLRNMLGYAYTAQATKEELLLFVKAAYSLLGEKLPSETEKEE